MFHTTQGFGFGDINWVHAQLMFGKSTQPPTAFGKHVQPIQAVETSIVFAHLGCLQEINNQFMKFHRAWSSDKRA